MWPTASRCCGRFSSPEPHARGLTSQAGPDETPLARNPYFLALLPLHDALKATMLYRTGFWLLLGLAIAGWAWPARRTQSGAFAVSIAAAGIFYLLTFGLLGVATDFRYAHWGVVASPPASFRRCWPAANSGIARALTPFPMMD